MKLLNRENSILAIMGLTFGFVFVDRLSINFLMPFITQELDITNAQIGLLASALAMSWAISGYFLSNYCTRYGHRVGVLVISVILFSLFTLLSSIAASFMALLIIRVLMGIAEGPVLPIAQSILIEESSEKRRGFNMGFVQNAASNLLGSVLAPIILIYVAENYGWRHAFIVAGVPGLIVAFLIYKYIKLAPHTQVDKSVTSEAKSYGLGMLVRNKNVMVSIGLSCLMVAWMFSQLTFIPVYLTKVQGYSGYQMGSVMSILGVSAVISGLLVPMLSDMFGRARVFRLFTLIAIFCPLSVLFMAGSQAYMMISLFLFYFGLGAIPIVMATVPSESVPRKYVVGTLGFVMGVTELVGGFMGPSISGVLADIYGLNAPFYFAAGLAGLAFIGSYMLKETSPKFGTVNQVANA
ncbi:MAG: MFS transporter [Oceanospirillaceae bacterium]|nr:MFS transporter [Oceanospirillaceae bacterium]